MLTATSDRPDRITLHWDIAEGYYLYRDKVKVAAAAGDVAARRAVDSRPAR